MTHQTIIGFDLGGTKSAIGVFNAETFALERYERFQTHAEKGFDHVFEDLVGMISDLRTPQTVGIGLGVPGLLKQPEGILTLAPNIPGSENIPLKARLRQSFDLPVFVENDAHCFALAEALMGAGKGQKVVVGITFGTGVGGGLVIDGKLYYGSHGYGAEFGHMLLRPGEPPAEAKSTRGEVEEFISGTALRKRCITAESPEDLLDGAACEFLHPAIFREVAWLCVNLTYALDPSIIVFGGSTGLALKPHLEKIKAEFREWLLPGTEMPDISTQMIEHPSTLGAALLCRQ